MGEPTTPSEVRAFHDLRKANPAEAVRVATQWIESDPTSSTAYFSRHQAWLTLGETSRALDDINRAIALSPTQSDYEARGDIYRSVGDYRRAVDDYRHAEAIDPTRWTENALPLLSQADAHAGLGDERKALDCCSRLPEHFWTPGPFGLPPGGKSEIAAELKRRSAMARARNART